MRDGLVPGQLESATEVACRVDLQGRGAMVACRNSAPARGERMTRCRRACIVVLGVLGPLGLAGVARAQDQPAAPATLATVRRFPLAASPIGLRGDVRPQQYLGRRRAALGLDRARDRARRSCGCTRSSSRAASTSTSASPSTATPCAGRTWRERWRCGPRRRPSRTATRPSRSASTSWRRSTSRGCWCCSRWTATARWRSRSRSASCCSTRGPPGSAASTRSGAPTTAPSCCRRACAAATRSSARRGRARGSDHPAHALPDAPSTFTIPVDPARAAHELVPIAIAAGTGPRADVAASYRRLIARASEIYGARRRHADELRERALRDRDARRAAEPRLRVGEGEPRRADGVQPGPRLRARRRLGPVGPGRAAGLRLVLRRRHGDQLARDGGDGTVGAGARRPAADRAPPARRRQAAARDLAVGRARALVQRVPLPVLPRGHDAVLAARAVAAVAGDGRREAARGAVAGGEEGLGLVPAERHRRRRHHREHDRRPRRDRGGRDRRGHPPGRVPRGRVDASGRRRRRDGRGAGRAGPRGAGRGARREGARVDGVALLARRRRPPRVRRAALGEAERHADGLAGDGGGLRRCSSRRTRAARSRRSRRTR